jgi:quercetin dioxygenase-like cupin family protein
LKGRKVKILTHYSDSEPRQHSGDEVQGVTGRVVIGKEDGARNFCMRVFTISPGGHTPCHSHDWEHEVIVHAGSGQVLQAGTWVDVSAGSVIFIPANEEHQLRNNGSEGFVFVCLIPTGIPEL